MKLFSAMFLKFRRRTALAALCLVGAGALGACGTRDNSAGQLAADGDGTSPLALTMKIADTPESGGEPDRYLIWIAGPVELSAASVRLCLGDVAACRLPTATYLNTRQLTNNGKVMYVTEQPVKLSQNLILTSVAQTATGNQIAQKTVRVTAVGTVTQPPPVQPQGDSDCYKGDPVACEAEKLIVEYTNAYRARSGRQPLKHHAKLAFVSRDWSEKQAKQYGMGHTGFSQGWRSQVYKAEFGSMGSLSISAENVAMSGYSLSEAAGIARHFADMWWNSSGHRANMLGNHEVLGAGVYKSGRGWYATQIFGRE